MSNDPNTGDNEQATPDNQPQQRPTNGEVRSYGHVLANSRDAVVGSADTFKKRMTNLVPGHEQHADELDAAYESYTKGHDEVSAGAREVLLRLGIPAEEIDSRFAVTHGRKEEAKYGTFAARREQRRAVKNALKALREGESEGNRDDFVRSFVLDSNSNVDDWFLKNFEAETLAIFLAEDATQAQQRVDELVEKVMQHLSGNADLENAFIAKTQDRESMEEFRQLSEALKKELLRQIVQYEALNLGRAAGLMRFLANMPAEAIDAYFGETVDPEGDTSDEPNMASIFANQSSIADHVPEGARVQVIINNREYDWYRADGQPNEVTQALAADARVVQLFYREDSDINALMAHLSVGQTYTCKRADSDADIVLEGGLEDEYKVVDGLAEAEIEDFRARPMKYIAFARPTINLDADVSDGANVSIPKQEKFNWLKPRTWFGRKSRK